MNSGIALEIGLVMPEVYASGMMPSLASFSLPDGLQGPTGAPSGVFVAVSGLQNIPCKNAPISTSRLQATEKRDLEDILAQGYRHILLNGWYPTIDDLWRSGGRCTVDGTVYTLLGVEPDSMHAMTRLHLQEVTI